MDKPEIVNLSWNDVGNVFISETNPTTQYIRADVVDRLLKEQRQRCTTDIAEYAEMRSATLHDSMDQLSEICLNATGESDESQN